MHHSDYSTSARRRLNLDAREGIIGGVCAGLGRYLKLEPSWIRIATIVAGVFFTKLVVAAYLIAWFVLDERSPKDD